jgi:hypothetical protein
LKSGRIWLLYLLYPNLVVWNLLLKLDLYNSNAEHRIWSRLIYTTTVFAKKERRADAVVARSRFFATFHIAGYHFKKISN